MNKKIGGLLILFILCVFASDVLGIQTVFYGTPSVNGVTVITGTNISLLVNTVYRTSVLADASAPDNNGSVYQIQCPDDTAAADNASFMIENLTAVGWGLCNGDSILLNINATDNTAPVNTSSISPTSLTYDNSGNVNLSGVGTCSDDGYGMNETGPYRLAHKAMGSSPDTNCNVGGYTNLTWGISNDISFAGAADNYYCIQLQCQDLAGNIGYYNSSNNVLYDPTAPTISLVNSSFNTSNIAPSVTFNYTDATSSRNNANCTLYVDGTGVASNSTTLNWTNTVLTFPAQSDGTHTAYVNCTDLAGNIGKSSTLTVMIDSVAPTVTISSPAAGNWTSDNTPTITFKFVDSISPGASCTIDINGTANGTNAAVVNNTDTTIDVTPSLSDNIAYSLKVNCTDNVGSNRGSSDAQSLNIDTSNPTVSLSIPTTNNWTTDTTPDFTFNVTDALSSSFSCVLDINGTNYGTNGAVANNTVTTITAAPALTQAAGYSWNVNCSDQAGKTDQDTARIINIDNTAPTVNLNIPATNNWTNDTTPDFTFNVTDNINATLSCVLDINGTSYGTNAAVANNTATTITANPALAENTRYSWKINCSDQLQTTAATARTINVDNTAPTVSLSSPTTANWTTSTTPSFVFNVTDALATSFNCLVSINGTSYGTNGGVANNTATTITASVMSANTGYSWNVNCSDQAGKTAQAGAARTINIDNTAPTVNLNIPANNNWTNDTTPDFTFNVTDNINATLSCVLDINGTSYGTNGTVMNNTATTITASTISQNTGYSWKINCSDQLQTTAATARTINIDNTAPSVTINSPSANASTNDNTTAINLTFTDTLSSTASCTIDVNGTAYGINTGVANNTATVISINGTGLADNTSYSLKVNCTDNAGKLGSSTAQSLSIDTTAPSITAITTAGTTSTTSSGTATITTTTSENASCWYSTTNFTAQNTTGATAMTRTETSQTFSITYTSTGTIGPYYISCRDIVGNNMTTSNTTGEITVTVTETTTHHGGGGGGGGGISTNPTTSQTWSTILPGSNITMKISNDDFGIKEITLEVIAQVSNAKITLEKFQSRPLLTDSEAGDKVFRYLSITSTNLPDSNINGLITIKFQVTQSWLLTNGVNASSIVLKRYVNGTWVELPTTLLSSDSKYAYYESETPGLSYFAIAEKSATPAVTTPPATTTPTETPATQPPETQPSTPATQPSTPATQPSTTTTKAKSSVLGTVLVMIAIILAIFLIIMAVTKKKGIREIKE